MIDRKEVVAVAGIAVADRPGDRLLVDIEVLGERGIQHLNHGNVETVQPEDGSETGVAMIVPGPRWRNDEIALMHDRALTIDSGVGAFAFEDEAQC